jgi:uncharacterized membrane protein YdbT with pleckstrin-like domain
VAFPRRLLTEGEELVVDTRPHWIALVGAVLVTILIVAAEVFLLTRIHGHGTGSRIPRWIVGGAGIVLFVIYPLRRFVHWATSHFVVTNQRIIHRQGWLAKTSMEVPLQRINDVRFRQGILDRMVGAGDLIIESAGTRGQEVFSDIRNPEAMQRTIYERAEAREHPAAAQAAPAPAATAAVPSVGGAAEELARLADLRDRGVLTEDEFQAQKAKLLADRQ